MGKQEIRAYLKALGLEALRRYGHTAGMLAKLAKLPFLTNFARYVATAAKLIVRSSRFAPRLGAADCLAPSREPCSKNTSHSMLE